MIKIGKNKIMNIRNDYARVITIDDVDYVSFIETSDKYMKFIVKDSVLMGMTDAIDETYEIVNFTGKINAFSRSLQDGTYQDIKLVFAFGKLLKQEDGEKINIWTTPAKPQTQEES
jgi:hypothetical protein